MDTSGRYDDHPWYYGQDEEDEEDFEADMEAYHDSFFR